MARQHDPEELDEFVRKAELLQSQISAIASGELDPADVRVAGEGCWAAAAAQHSAAAQCGALPAAAADCSPSVEAGDRAAGLALQRKWDGERSVRLAGEEHERWWKFARMQFGDEGLNGAAA